MCRAGRKTLLTHSLPTILRITIVIVAGGEEGEGTAARVGRPQPAPG